MSLKTRVYIGSVLTLGALALGRALAGWDLQDPLRFICYLLLSIPASCLKVRLPGITGTMSVLFLFLLAGIVELGLPATVLIGVTCVLAQCYWRAKIRPRPIQVVFSMANIAITVTAAHFIYHLKTLPVSGLQPPFRLALAATVFFLTNSFPVATVIALTEKKSLTQVWRKCYAWSFPYYLVGAAIVGIFSFTNRTLDWQAWLLILPVIYVTYRSYRVYLDQLETERLYAEEQRSHAEEVAALHARAVQSLNSAMHANARLDAVVESSPLAILVLDSAGQVRRANSTAEKMFGWRPVGGSDRTLSPHAELRGIVAQTLSGESISGLELKIRRRDGSSFPTTIWTAPLCSQEGGLPGALVTMADVSDSKRMEEQLRISQKMEAVGRLAGGIAHDFNNLLTVINGYSSMLVDSLKHDAYARGQAEEIMNAGNRAASLVAQLLTFSRHQVIMPDALNVNRLVQDVETMLRRLLGEHIRLRTSLDPNAGWTVADRNQMETMLINLATNAQDAMPEGGTLLVETACVEIAPGAPAAEPDLIPGSYVRLVVSDTGHGMDAQTQQHLFEPFFTTKEVGKGTGLGLSSVYAGVQKAHGRIFVKSELSKGTTFSIYLPRCKQPDAPESHEENPERQSHGNGTILLVEDEISVRRMLREALSRAGYRILEAGNGVEALDLWGADPKKFDLLVTDAVMPEMNGLRLAEEFIRRRPDLKIIFMSGHSEEIIRKQDCEIALRFEYLQKPFLPEVLVRRAGEVFEGLRQMRAASK